MTPLAAVALTAATLGLAICGVRGARALIRWADRRMERLLRDAFTYDLDDEYRALIEAEDA